MDEIDKKDWYKFRCGKKNSLSNNEYTLVSQLHSKYFKHRFYKPCTCNPNTIKTWIGQLNELYENDSSK